MERQGKQNAFKHGGVRLSTRGSLVSNVLITDGEISIINNDNNNRILVDDNVFDTGNNKRHSVACEQDGEVGTALHTPNDLSADCDILDADRVDEWLKNRSDSLSSIEFDCEVKHEDDYEVHERFETDGCDRSTTASSSDHPIIDSNIASTYDESQFQTTEHLVRVGESHAGSLSKIVNYGSNRKHGRNGKSKTTPDSVSTACCSSSSIVVNSVSSLDVNLSKSDFKGVTLLGDCVHETVDGCENNEDDDNADETSCISTIFPNESNICFSDSAKNVTLMTPQELERMPESGIEFEESVGPKEFEILLKHEQDDVTGSSEHDQLEFDCSLSLPINGKELDNGFGTSCAQKLEESQQASECCGEENDAEVQNSEQAATSTLATISISTDKTTNTTSIVINTKQGQKSFVINTANLMQAAETLQPVTLADLVEQKGLSLMSNGEVPGISIIPESVKAETSNDDSDLQNELINTVPEMEELLHSLEAPNQENTEKAPKMACLQEKRLLGNMCTHTGRCSKVWTCPEPDCGKVHKKQSKLKVHMMTHSSLRPFKCMVEGCDWAFTTIYKLKRHLESHCSLREFVCDHKDCNRGFTTVYNLKSHKKLHEQEKMVKCSVESCGKSFPTRRKMELHMKEHSEIEAPYKCPMESCNKAYYTTNSMASHFRSHQKMSLECPFDGCNMVFDKMSRFKVHMWRHSGEKPYACTFQGCNWAFSSASKLNRHARKHTGERRYTCSTCQKSFMRLEHLQGHMVTHLGIKPYKCSHENCDARFTARSSLYVHMKKHDGRASKTVYLCPAENCQKKYNCKSSLRFHMQRYHATKLASDSGQVEYITLVATDDVQEATTTVDEHGCMISVVGAEEALAGPSLADSTASNLTSSSLNDDEIPIGNEEQAISDFIVPDLCETITAVPEVSSSVTPIPDEIAIDLPKEEAEILSRVLHANNSGSARTDYCGNYVLSSRQRKSRQLNEDTLPSSQLEGSKKQSCGRKKRLSSDYKLASSDDSVLNYRISKTSRQFTQTSFLQEESPLGHNDMYQDGLLVQMTDELSLPVALMRDSSTTSQGADFVSSSSTIVEFPGTTINLQDLE